MQSVFVHLCALLFLPVFSPHIEMPFVIACDIDEVLFPYLAGYCKYYNRLHKTNWDSSHFHSYNFSKVHGGTESQIADLVYAFHNEPEFFEIEPIAGSVDAIGQLAKLGEIHFVTSRQAAISKETCRWIKDHFGYEPERVHIGNHWIRKTDLVQTKKTKLEMCQTILANVLIDDSAEYAIECAPTMHVILFDLHAEYGWNKHLTDPHPNINRVHSWPEAIAHIKRIKQLTSIN